MSSLQQPCESRSVLSLVLFVIAFTSSFISPGVTQTTPTVVLHGGNYQLIPSSGQCLVSNRFTAACSCPSSYDTTCFDALIYSGTTVDVSNTVDSSSSTRINSNFCICERTRGLSTAAVYGGGYQQDDPVGCTANCRYPNPHTGSCSCPSGFQSTSLRTLVFGVGTGCTKAVLGSHIVLCIRSASARAVGTIVNDAATFTVTAPVLNNFHGVYAISADQSALSCILNNVLPVRSSRYLTSISAAGCNCPVSACAASFFWLTDGFGYPSKYQRVVVCESSMQLAVDPSTERSKVMLGYQSWQSTSKNSFNTGWSHWSRKGDPLQFSLVNYASFDVWPDTSEFPSANLSSAALARPDGSVTTLYDAYLDQTTQLHFQWLQYYGLDGMWLQRFLSELGDTRFLAARNAAVNHVAKYSVQYQRVFGVMWDMSGMTNANLYSTLQADIARLKQQGIFDSSAYVRHNGKPLVTIWGFGVREEVNVNTALSSITLLKNSNFAVMGGVSFFWRSQLGANGENFTSVFNAFDIISPWAVGAYYSPQNYLSFAPALQSADASYCAQHNILYVPVVYPGFSWTNAKNHTPGNVLNQMPRYGGGYWQTQADSLESTTISNSAFSHLFVAMFDEFDEGTAITKAAESYLDKPAQGTFLSYDADGFHVPNDHYLCLASRQTYRQHQPLSISFPYTFRTSSSHPSFIYSA